MARALDRRTFLSGVAYGTAGVLIPSWPGRVAHAERVLPDSPHFAVGKTIAATSSSKEATEAALWALAEGGNAADAYITAAITQTVEMSEI